MNAEEKRKLSTEAEMQMAALKRIGRWRNIAIAFSSIGVAGIYTGKALSGSSLFLSVFGIAAVIMGIAVAFVLNLGIKNGRSNVEKMLGILEKGIEHEM